MRDLLFRAESLTGELIYFGLHGSQLSSNPDIFYAAGIACKIGTEQQYSGKDDIEGFRIFEGDLTQFGKVEFSFGCWNVNGDVPLDNIRNIKIKSRKSA